MSDEINETQPDELTLLKARADQMGIPYKGNIGIETLKGKIEAKMSGEKPAPDPEEEFSSDEENEAPKVLTEAERQQEVRNRLSREKLKLVRVRISNLNPAKNDLHGEIITVRNKFIGTVRRMIPFGEATDGGYHIEQIIYDDLKSRRFQQIRTKRVNGQIQHEARLVPEYAIEVMPPLSDEERTDLAQRQQAAERLSGRES